jgi:hypothetical protein
MQTQQPPLHRTRFEPPSKFDICVRNGSFGNDIAYKNKGYL